MSRNTIPQWVKDAKPKMCAVCNRTDDLQYHHWEPKGGDVPENIIVLCAKHHQEWHQQRGKTKHNRLVKEGIAAAKDRGVRVGRKPSDHENIIRMIAERSSQFNDIQAEGGENVLTEGEIMQMAGIKEVCYYKCKRMLLNAIAEDEWPYSWPKPKVVNKHPLYDHVIKDYRAGKWC